MKAVIFTDTIQWIILLAGLMFIGIPMAFQAVGGWEGISSAIPHPMLSLNHISVVTFLNWAITIIPIWFVGMTLYQRICACRSEREAKKAWFIAGLFEYPIMAFMGVFMGVLARVALEQGLLEGYASAQTMDAEQGLPLLLKNILPAGIMGLMLSAYFSAILSTADSCLMAASGNVVTDIICRFFKLRKSKELRFSMMVTLGLGFLAIFLASSSGNVLDLMLMSYAFMVSGLFVTVLGMIFWKKKSETGAVTAMIGGGMITILLGQTDVDLPFGLDPNVFGILASALLFISITIIKSNSNHENTTA